MATCRHKMESELERLRMNVEGEKWLCRCACHNPLHNPQSGVVEHVVPCCEACPHGHKFVVNGFQIEHLKRCLVYKKQKPHIGGKEPRSNCCSVCSSRHQLLPTKLNISTTTLVDSHRSSTDRAMSRPTITTPSGIEPEGLQRYRLRHHNSQFDSLKIRMIAYLFS
jgi:hypothetical protein